jgi:hypothetical protein
MESSAAKMMPAEELLFRDGLGDRLLIRDASRKPLHEAFLLRTELSGVPVFEMALNSRVTQLTHFDHPAFVRVRRLARVAGPRVSIVGDHARGTRLSELLTAMDTTRTPAAVPEVLFVAREILDGVSALHRQSSDIAHGALAPERIVVNTNILITDYVLGSAIEELHYSAERYWRELRVAVPASAGALRLDRRADVAQIGMITLALLAGRPLRESEHMGNVTGVLMSLALPDSIKGWLIRMLHMDPRRAYVSAIDAAQGLQEALTEANIQPAPLVLSALGIRTEAVGTPVRMPTYQPVTAPVFPDIKKPPTPRPQQDPWNAHETDSDRRFPEEVVTVADDVVAPRPSRFARRLNRRLKSILKIGILGAALAGGFTAAQYVPAPAMFFSQMGTLVVESSPAGVPLMVDGELQGVTPLTLKLKTGRHEVELRGGGKPRVFNVYISSGSRVSQYVEFRGSTARPRKTE